MKLNKIGRNNSSIIYINKDLFHQSIIEYKNWGRSNQTLSI
ncbi:hypothetical protein ASZ90_017438 [hydrocarbon metagenome]|uniref:Uncharacterized protein n=1 Tax=hydrocarbon metagenome TaxID=938273 RepID=A0A0W8E9E2_9ZZZZ